MGSLQAWAGWLLSCNNALHAPRDQGAHLLAQAVARNKRCYTGVTQQRHAAAVHKRLLLTLSFHLCSGLDIEPQQATCSTHTHMCTQEEHMCAQEEHIARVHVPTAQDSYIHLSIHPYSRSGVQPRKSAFSTNRHTRSHTNVHVRNTSRARACTPACICIWTSKPPASTHACTKTQADTLVCTFASVCFYVYTSMLARTYVQVDTQARVLAYTYKQTREHARLHTHTSRHVSTRACVSTGGKHWQAALEAASAEARRSANDAELAHAAAARLRAQAEELSRREALARSAAAEAARALAVAQVWAAPLLLCPRLPGHALGL